eukprot:TRINITY_DN19468_c0_g1_i1.p1 TRINITY_DN19468_c0_g1~~TRINITY_DN19468_c0_g1_i1.p1  ORF type:complete len:363 (-),score=31.94 TRINITY_DN19468_c0_g1_i1:46-1134(-)
MSISSNSSDNASGPVVQAVKKLSELDRPSIEDHFFRYYNEAPIWKYALPDDKKRHNFIKENLAGRVCSFMLRSGRVYGMINENDVVGIGVWYAPGEKLNTTVGDLIKIAGTDTLKAGLGSTGRYFSCVKKLKRAQAELMKGIPHWRIMHPSPAWYSLKVGKALISMVMDWAAADNVPIYHEVYQEDQIHFFLKYGFECVKTIVISESPDIKCWVLILPQPDPLGGTRCELPMYEESNTSSLELPSEDQSTSNSFSDSGTFVTNLEKKTSSLSELLGGDLVTADRWERNLSSLENGEWSDEMSPLAFRRYLKNRAKVTQNLFRRGSISMQEMDRIHLDSLITQELNKEQLLQETESSTTVPSS